jgi:2',3'-cyclic-nucleotide 2'-phosphodiesterase (5'-nucleotidase family)
MMSEFHYDVITPGDRELRPGLATLKALYGKHPEIQVVSANIQDKSGRRVFPEYTIIERGGLRFGITGTTGAVYYETNVKQNLVAKDDFTFQNSEEALRRVVPELRAKSDVVIVLLHESVEDAMNMLTKVSGIDVAIAGNEPGIIPAPEKIGDALFVRPGSRGQYVFRLPITVDTSAKKIVEFAGEAKYLDEKVTKDPVLDPVVSKWENDFKAKYSPPPPAKPAPAKPAPATTAGH